ncbi:MAG: phosphoribosylamine--glycine ligase, partial [Actinomycetota bacterium]
MKVLVIGSGGREHCLVWKISKSPLAEKIYAVPGNGGISEIAECIDIKTTKNDFNELLKFAEDKKIDLTVVGPEGPLVDGIADCFQKKNLRVFGPVRHAAAIEGSKVFARELLDKYGIPIPEGVVFTRENYGEAIDYIGRRKKFPVVIKADGLAAGKGVTIAIDKGQATEAIKECFVSNKFGNSGDRIIIEEYLTGYEVSILSFCDGKKIIPMDPAQDYKRIFDNDEGKNTGGMGSYSPVPVLKEEVYKRILNEIIFPTGTALANENITYRGILYAGVLICNDKPYLLEYNCRFGDPETQVILPRLAEDLLPILMECADGNLSREKLDWDKNRCVCVVAASEGYPESSSSGDIITGLDNFTGSDDIIVFHAG